MPAKVQLKQAAVRPNPTPDDSRVNTTRRRFLGRTFTTGAAVVTWPAILLPATAPPTVSDEDRRKIEAALPPTAPAVPRKPRKLLVFDGNVNYGGHASIPTANLAFTLMGRKTGAYETVISRDPAVFAAESLRSFDAVFFNNNVGNLFPDAARRENLASFVHGGGGLLGVHGSSVAFTRWPGASEDWPEFGRMIGARGANHRDNTELVVTKLDDPTHPINSPFSGQGFEYRDEFFRFQTVYSRQKVRVLFSIDTDKSPQAGLARGNCLRADNDYALAWVRSYGRGRAFYCTIAHNPYVFWDPKMLAFYLGAIQFALSDLPAPTLPSAKLTPGARARETLGWRVELHDPSLSGTLFELAERAASHGVSHIGGTGRQPLHREYRRPWHEWPEAGEQERARLKLDDTGTRLLTFRLDQQTMADAGSNLRTVFETGQKLGVETLMTEGIPAPLKVMERWGEELDLNLALQPAWGNGEKLETILQKCRAHGPRVGVGGEVAAWQRASMDPVEAVRQLRERLLVLTLPVTSLVAASELPMTRRLLTTLHELHLKPVISLVGEATPPGDLAGALNRLDEICLHLAKPGLP